jgi:hypothetical protein
MISTPTSQSWATNGLFKLTRLYFSTYIPFCCRTTQLHPNLYVSCLTCCVAITMPTLVRPEYRPFYLYRATSGHSVRNWSTGGRLGTFEFPCKKQNNGLKPRVAAVSVTPEVECPWRACHVDAGRIVGFAAAVERQCLQFGKQK